MNCVEEKLWNYIDGNCSPEEQQAMDILIATDEVYKRKYHELVKLNLEFACMELDEPSMGFSFKVMETIRTENAMKPLKAAVDKRIIKGITAFFIFSIAVMLIFAVKQVNWSAGNGGSSVLPAVNVKMPHIESYLNGPLLKAFILFDIVAGLVLLDGYLRKKLNKTATE